MISGKNFLNLSKALFFILAIALFVGFVNPINLYSFIAKQDLYLVFYSVLFLTISYIVYSMRWALIVVMSTDNKGYFNLCLSYLISLFYNSFTPSNIGGDIYRVFSDSSTDIKKSKIVGFIIFERIIGLLIFSSLSLIVVLDLINSFSKEDLLDLLIQNSLLTVILFSVIVMIFIFRNFLARQAKSFITRFDYISYSLDTIFKSFKNKKLLFVTTFFSLMGILLSVIAFREIINSNGLYFSFWSLLGIFCAIELIRVLPITYQGFGLRESFFAFCALSISNWSFEEGIYIAGLYYILVSFALALTGFTVFISKNTINFFLKRRKD